MMTCVVCGKPDHRVCPACWQRLPLALRRRYWRETNYSQRDPPPELVAEIKREASK